MWHSCFQLLYLYPFLRSMLNWRCCRHFGLVWCCRHFGLVLLSPPFWFGLVSGVWWPRGNGFRHFAKFLWQFDGFGLIGVICGFAQINNFIQFCKHVCCCYSFSLTFPFFTCYSRSPLASLFQFLDFQQEKRRSFWVTYVFLEFFARLAPLVLSSDVVVAPFRSLWSHMPWVLVWANSVY